MQIKILSKKIALCYITSKENIFIRVLIFCFLLKQILFVMKFTTEPLRGHALLIFSCELNSKTEACCTKPESVATQVSKVNLLSQIA